VSTRDPGAGPLRGAGEEVESMDRKEWLLGLYRTMVLVREFEDRVKVLFLEGTMPGTIHQYQGQEACAVGVCAALGADDVITSTHRPHGHALAKGLTADEIMAELFGKVTGCCKGKGGSMHVGDLAKGMVPAGAGCPSPRAWASPSRCGAKRGWPRRSWATVPPARGLSTKP
jgi:TPP-dependent pyruvate/acetoin dehydrogenase alpha subunit